MNLNDRIINLLGNTDNRIKAPLIALKLILLRNAALNPLKYQQELNAVRSHQIDILHFQKIKEAHASSESQLRLVNGKAEDLSIKKLTKNAPAARAMFNDLAAEGECK